MYFLEINCKNSCDKATNIINKNILGISSLINIQNPFVFVNIIVIGIHINIITNIIVFSLRFLFFFKKISLYSDLIFSYI